MVLLVALNWIPSQTEHHLSGQRELLARGRRDYVRVGRLPRMRLRLRIQVRLRAGRKCSGQRLPVGDVAKVLGGKGKREVEDGGRQREF